MKMLECNIQVMCSWKAKSFFFEIQNWTINCPFDFYVLFSLDHQDSSTYHRIILTNCSLNLDTRGRGNSEGRSHYNLAFKAIDQSNRFNYGRSHYNMAFCCQWPIKSITEISVSLAFTSNFFVNNSSRRSSRCPRMISLDDRDYVLFSNSYCALIEYFFIYSLRFF